MTLALVPAEDTKPSKAEPRDWWDIPSKPMLAGLILLLAGVIGGLFARLDASRGEEVQNLKKAVAQAEDNFRNRVAERVAKTEAQITALEGGVNRLTVSMDKNTEQNAKLLQEFARLRGALDAKGEK